MIVHSEEVRRLRAAHKRMKTRRGKASAHKCVDCKERDAYDWSQIHGTTGEDPFDYEPRCRSCHQKYDYTDERRAKISVANKGKDYNKSMLGKKHSATSRQKMSEARLARDPD